MRSMELPIETLVAHGQCRPDSMAENILLKFEQNPKYLPVSVSGDGNCFFNSLSVAMYGSESKATEIRLLTALEMLENQLYYEHIHAGSRISHVSPDFEISCKDCLREGGFSSAWTMHAAASVLERPIISIYPPLNGLVDNCFVILNKHFTPRTSSTKRPIRIMWTVFGSSGSTGTWTPNHFVPLLPVRIAGPVTITIESSPEPELPELGRAKSTPHQKTRRVEKSPNVSKTCEEKDDIFSSLENTKLSPINPKQSKYSSTHNQLPEQDLSPLNELSKEYSSVQMIRAMNGPGRFMNPEEVLNTMMELSPSGCNVPDGLKENVYFLLKIKVMCYVANKANMPCTSMIVVPWHKVRRQRFIHMS
ncbi:vertnin-like isoform X1 [Anneissia japonica]|uniref:vertnin-like isoform X1 n=1 Tax=Anneissia japonica TaxID=1529436 RepID=UPI0014256EF7|nr:vertnin-like isoform X1 [Anneissia japonica]XP_033096397.1 vertnin-like isoform X1 [Anneissia japonica]XP_033096398.1 vertnin-like isoform X1 [Anneissia japonica]XP_033096400.1 vertnin-like isoform X1 [Anneissia japonica]